jgi:hypothetical protein
MMSTMIDPMLPTIAAPSSMSVTRKGPPFTT